MPLSPYVRITPKFDTKPSFGKLEQRLAHQSERINRLAKSGKLTAQEAAGLRTRVAKAQQSIHNDAFDGNGLSRCHIGDQLVRGIGKDIRRGATNDNRNLKQGLANLERRIERGLKSGALTADEATALKKKVAELRPQLEKPTTLEMRKQLGAKLDALSKEVRAEAHDGELDAGKRVADFNSRIAAGLRDGSLTRPEAERLLDRVAKVSANGGTGKDEVNALNRDIYRHRHNPTVSKPELISSLSSRIDSLSKSGKLTADQASAFRARLEVLKRNDATDVGPQLNLIRAQLGAFA